MRGPAPVAALCALLALAGSAASAPPERTHVLLFADRDDDDDDAVADGVAPRVEGRAREDVRWLEPREIPRGRGFGRLLSASVRWVVDGRGIPSVSGVPVGGRQVGLQGILPGHADVLIGQRAFEISVLELAAVDTHGARVDLTSSHASISRVLPAFLTNDDAGVSDEDALRWVAIGEQESLPEQVDVASIGADGRELDALLRVELWEMPCPPAVNAELACRGTPLIRATADRIDRGHPESSARSLQAEVGGRLRVMVAGRKAAQIRVGGPRTTAVGPIERLRARLNVHVLRAAPGGAPAVGGDDARAAALVRAEVDTASLLWGQCGIHFGVGNDVVVRLEDPPPPHLIAVGCGLGLPASGGEIRLRAGRRPVRVFSERGEPPGAVAQKLAQALRAAGFLATLSPNPRIEPGALATVDVLVRQQNGLASIERDGNAPVSSDASLSVCIGAVDLEDGLLHFTDYDAAAGTLEERTLIKAYADNSPATIDVFVVPAFSGVGRVGESFLDSPSGSIRNTVLVDRAAILAGARSHVLAHELGHVLLNLPGHPDDYGVDQPTALMDADATDPSIFGPRRLSVEECERALRERGPKARAPLLEAWPLVTRAR